MRYDRLDRDLWNVVKQHKVYYLGHILGRPRYPLLKLTLTDKIEGRRPKKNYIPGLETYTAKRAAREQEVSYC